MPASDPKGGPLFPGPRQKRRSKTRGDPVGPRSPACPSPTQADHQPHLLTFSVGFTLHERGAHWSVQQIFLRFARGSPGGVLSCASSFARNGSPGGKKRSEPAASLTAPFGRRPHFTSVERATCLTPYHASCHQQFDERVSLLKRRARCHV